MCICEGKKWDDLTDFHHPLRSVEPNYYRGELSSFDERLPPIYVEYGYTPAGKVSRRPC